MQRYAFCRTQTHDGSFFRALCHRQKCGRSIAKPLATDERHVVGRAQGRFSGHPSSSGGQATVRAWPNTHIGLSPPVGEIMPRASAHPSSVVRDLIGVESQVAEHRLGRLKQVRASLFVGRRKSASQNGAFEGCPRLYGQLIGRDVIRVQSIHGSHKRLAPALDRLIGQGVDQIDRQTGEDAPRENSGCARLVFSVISAEGF